MNKKVCKNEEVSGAIINRSRLNFLLRKCFQYRKFQEYKNFR